MTSQTRRSAISIPSNIVEGSCRGTRKDYNHFIYIAYGSASELETQIEIAKRLPKTKNLDFLEVDALLTEVIKMLNIMSKNLRYK